MSLPTLPSNLLKIVDAFGQRDMTESEINEISEKFEAMDDTMVIVFFNTLGRTAMSSAQSGRLSIGQHGTPLNLIELFKAIGGRVMQAQANLKLATKRDE